MEQKSRTNFAGTYFDKSAVLRLERWVRILAWAILAAYIFEGGYNAYQNVMNAWVGNFPLDYYFVFSNLFRVLQGTMVFAILQVAAKMVLILLDIEDNTRRAARMKGNPDS
ncbi:MAG: hypothetical protein EHM81_12260 [Chloroflexi bacterium]|nr:MAG: hypothetical protein EHM81_12260 [Chloroflexota bacterium]